MLRGGDRRTAPQGRVHVRRGEHAGERAVVVEDGQGGLVEAGEGRETSRREAPSRMDGTPSPGRPSS